MSHKSPKAIASSKSQTTQQTADLQPESLEAEELTAQEPVSLASQISSISNTPNPNAHAAIINRAVASPQSSQQVILQLQRQYGNRYVNRVLQQTRQLQTPIQAKLTLGAVGDKYEQEADRVAKQVVNQIQTSQLTSTTQTPSVQRDMMAQENKLQMKPADTIQREGVLDEENELGVNALLQRSATVDGGTITPDLETSIQQARGRGQPLPDNIRQPMEQAFGADFSGVKVHTDAQSDGLNQAVQAKAFTTGQDIFFRQGKYNPGSSIGQELLAHELTHVVQQTQGQIQSVQRSDDEELPGPGPIPEDLFIELLRLRHIAKEEKNNKRKENLEKALETTYYFASATDTTNSILGSKLGVLQNLADSSGELVGAAKTASTTLGVFAGSGAGILSGIREGKQAYDAFKQGNKAEGSAYALQALGDTASGALNIASNFSPAVGLATAASGTGAIYGTVNAFRYGTGAYNSHKRKKELENIASRRKLAYRFDPSFGRDEEDLNIIRAAEYAADIQRKARNRQALYATGGALQVAGGITTLVAGGTGVGAGVGIGLGALGTAIQPAAIVTQLLKQKGRDYAANYQDTKLGQTFGKIFNKEKSTKNKDKEREDIAYLLMKNHQDSDMQEILKNLPQVTKEEISKYQTGEMAQEDLISILKRREETLKLKVPNALRFSRKLKSSLPELPE
ncbi:hypothetical protein WA1_00180 [Scytonema hofmannii PCC 7110]|uniref:eCIS core domain-containing protein n=1 Tax=Scytonema hofmannii PCC 7110 TaxID=128403 RepID=A0A139XG10_9CYAN|nr:DUF4157 domain-containing protein [Scytonema hofmannii]KYC43627.1 hypothetical protein WA1_00180 [Scytonema hofmannii PCC 7110]